MCGTSDWLSHCAVLFSVQVNHVQTMPRCVDRATSCVQDVVISSDGQFALSGSWDGTLRLWDLSTGATTRRFLGHTKDVLSVAFSVDNRQARAQPLAQVRNSGCYSLIVWVCCLPSVSCSCAVQRPMGKSSVRGLPNQQRLFRWGQQGDGSCAEATVPEPANSISL